MTKHSKYQKRPCAPLDTALCFVAIDHKHEKRVNKTSAMYAKKVTMTMMTTRRRSATETRIRVKTLTTTTTTTASTVLADEKERKRERVEHE